MLGMREPDIYGKDSLISLEEYIISSFEDKGVEFEFFQSNYEGELIESIHSSANSDIDAIVYNPGAHTHYSYALRDAIASVDTPVAEVHLSDISSRESFRKKSVLSPVCATQIKGKGKQSYIEAVQFFLNNSEDVFKFRRVKTDEEIQILTEAQDIADRAFLNMLDRISSKMTEIQVKELLEDEMVKAGAQGFSFPTIVGCGENGANPHAEPQNVILENQGCVVIDFGVVYKGYCSDTTRTLFIGTPYGKLYRAWEAVKCANEVAKNGVAVGTSCNYLHNLAISILDEYGFGDCMPHTLGHGVGREIHEQPRLSPTQKYKLEENNVITIEPGVYIEKEFGIRLEDCGYVKRDGFHSFTKLDHDLIVI